MSFLYIKARKVARGTKKRRGWNYSGPSIVRSVGCLGGVFHKKNGILIVHMYIKWGYLLCVRVLGGTLLEISIESCWITLEFVFLMNSLCCFEWVGGLVTSTFGSYFFVLILWLVVLGVGVFSLAKSGRVELIKLGFTLRRLSRCSFVDGREAWRWTNTQRAWETKMEAINDVVRISSWPLSDDRHFRVRLTWHASKFDLVHNVGRPLVHCRPTWRTWEQSKGHMHTWYGISIGAWMM